MSKKVKTYLKELVKKLGAVLGSNLVGVYLQGSSAQKDYRDNKSDLDVIAVTRKPIPDNQKNVLGFELEHKKIPVPSAGLDLMIITKSTAQHPTPEPEYEFWFSTGEGWDTSIDKKGSTSEVLIFLATCSKQARTIFGLDSREVFSPVPYKMLLQTLIDILKWHRKKTLDNFHDPMGQYSILNASRAWMYAEDKKLGSKTDGGKWVLAREPNNELVKNALLVRDGKSKISPGAKEVDLFLQRVLGICKERLKI